MLVVKAEMRDGTIVYTDRFEPATIPNLMGRPGGCRRFTIDVGIPEKEFFGLPPMPQGSTPRPPVSRWGREIT